MINEPIAIIGGGAAGHCMAADLSLTGYKVNLYEHPKFKDTIQAVLDTGVVHIRTNETDTWREAKIHKVTIDMKDAVSDARMINVVIPAFGHDFMFDAMIPCLENGQVVAIYTDNFGSLRLRKMLNERRPDLKITIYGITSQPYGTRMVSPGSVGYGYGLGPSMRARGEKSCLGDYKLGAAALPATETGVALKDFQELWPTQAAQDVLAVFLNNANLAVHPLGSLLNAGRVEYSRGDFYLYREGITPSVLRAEQRLFDEIIAVGKAYGRDVTFCGMTTDVEAVMGHLLGPDANVAFSLSSGPNSLQHRYFTEDIPFGLFGVSQLAKKVGLETPLIDAVIAIGSVVCQMDVHKVGRTLESIGLAELSREEIIKLVQG